MIDIPTTDRTEIVDITTEVADRVPADLDRGVCTVFVAHTTAGVVINEAESRLLRDLNHRLEEFAPSTESYEHDEIDNNADAHLRTLLLGHHVSVPIRDGDLAMGTWQSILFVECDGPRTRHVSVTVIPAVD